MKAIKCFITFKSIVVNDNVSKIVPPLSIDELKQEIDNIRNHPEKLSEQDLIEFGSLLFKRVFTEAALDQYRITDPSIVTIAPSSELAFIPWELLHDGKDWIAKTRGIIRIAETPRKSPELLPKLGNLKILATMSSPILNETMPEDDPEQISTVDIKQHLDAFQRLEGEPLPIDIKLNKHITKEILSKEISSNYHIWHFVGHIYNGQLVFETRQASIELIDKVKLQEYITIGIRGGLRLIVQNSCYSENAYNEIYNIANTIMETGLPALVIMQNGLSEYANQEFIKAFYGALAKGKTIDSAMLISRQSMSSDWQANPIEWSTPILFVNDSLINEDISLNITDAEIAEAIDSPKVSIFYPLQAKIDHKLTREDKFVGRREELNTILRSLDPERQDSEKFINIYGDSGTGKTAIIIESIDRIAEWFDEIICLLTENLGFDSILNPRTLLMAIAYKYNINLREYGTDIELKNDLINGLDDNKKRLFVIEDLIFTSDVLKSFLNELPANCKAIITSNKALELGGKQTQIGMLKQIDAIKLCYAYKKDLERIEKLTLMTGGHPMLTKLAISQVASGERTLDNVLKDIKKAKGDLVDHIVDSSLKLALKDGRKILAVMSLFYPNANKKAIQDICNMNDETFNKAIKRLTDLSLIESYQNGKRLGIHQIIRTKAEKLLESDQDCEKFYESLAKYIMEFLNATIPMTNIDVATKAIEGQMPENTSKEHLKDVATQILVKPAIDLIEMEIFNCLSVLKWAMKKGDLEKTMKISDSLSDFLAKMGYWDIINQYLLGMSELLEKQNNLRLQATAIFNLGTLNYKQGKIDSAIESYQSALNIAKKSQDYNLIAQSLNALGYAYLEKDNIDKAIKSFESLLEIYKSIDDDLSSALLLNNLGSIYQNNRELEKAFQCFNSARRIFHQRNDKYGEASAITNIAGYY
ncbi:MAG: tetratricopeptide repeat protein, partial [Candidatus Poribacteria bacterium]